MKRHSRVKILMAIGVPALGAAFVISQPTAQSEEIKPVAARRQVPAQAQARLMRDVGHELRMLAYYTVFDNLEFRVTGYTVELFGQVTRPTLKSEAEAAVKSVEGVESVRNRIEVLPVSFEDDRIRLALYQSIFSHPTMTRYAMQAVSPVHILVKNGNVTLVGVVATEMEKNIAYMQARGVPGIFSVTNKLQVETKGG